MGDQQPGLQARLMSQALRKLTGSISRSNCMVIFINQIRMKIGVMYGSPETTTGGNALKFYASVRLDIRRISTLKDRDQPIGKASGQGGQEQGGAAVQAGRVRHHVRRGRVEGRRADRPRRQGRHRREVGSPGSPTTASASARAARTRRASCATTPTSPTRSRPRSGRIRASSPTRSSRMPRRPPTTSTRGRPDPADRFQREVGGRRATSAAASSFSKDCTGTGKKRGFPLLLVGRGEGGAGGTAEPDAVPSPTPTPPTTCSDTGQARDRLVREGALPLSEAQSHRDV